MKIIKKPLAVNVPVTSIDNGAVVMYPGDNSHYLMTDEPDDSGGRRLVRLHDGHLVDFDPDAGVVIVDAEMVIK